MKKIINTRRPNRDNYGNNVDNKPEAKLATLTRLASHLTVLPNTHYSVTIVSQAERKRLFFYISLFIVLFEMAASSTHRKT